MTLGFLNGPKLTTPISLNQGFEAAVTKDRLDGRRRHRGRSAEHPYHLESRIPLHGPWYRELHVQQSAFGYDLGQQPFHRQHRARRAELSIPLI